MILRADARHMPLRDGCVQTVVTSPPYWGLRDYQTGRWLGGDSEHAHDTMLARNGRGGSGTPGKQTPEAFPTAFACPECSCGARRIDAQIGLEPTPEEYAATMVGVFREVRRVLRDNGTVWLNLGDSYNAHPGQRTVHDKAGWKQATDRGSCESASRNTPNLKAKDLIGIPWRIAFALQADGWYLRSDIIWAKPNPMPESVTDRPTRSHEYIFLLSKSSSYFYDADAIREPWADERNGNPGCVEHGKYRDATHQVMRNDFGGPLKAPQVSGRNKRSVWTVNSEPTPEAHFATFPQKLIEPCILAGSRPLDLVLDPFIGSGTVGNVAERFGRRWVGLELSENYIEIAKNRTAQRGLGL